MKNLLLLLLILLVSSITAHSQTPIFSTEIFRFVKSNTSAIDGRSVELKSFKTEHDQIGLKISLDTKFKEGDLKEQIIMATDLGQYEIDELSTETIVATKKISRPIQNTVSANNNNNNSFANSAQNGIETQVNSDGSISTTTQSGNISTTTNSNGTVSTTTQNGNISTTTNSNGTTSTTHHSGNVSTTVNSDGTVSTSHHHTPNPQANSNNRYNAPRPVRYEWEEVEFMKHELEFILNKEMVEELKNAKRLVFEIKFAEESLRVGVRKGHIAKLISLK